MGDIVIAVVVITFIVILSLCMLIGIIPDLRKIFSKKYKHDTEELQDRIEELEMRICDLEQSVYSSASKEMRIVLNDKDEDSHQFLNVSNLKVKSTTISYIASQSIEQEGGNSRIKVIHYSKSSKIDSVYSTFETILEQLPGCFMQINKNYIVNLGQIHKIQGDEIFLNNVPKPFYVSENRFEEFELRMKNQ